MSVAAAFSIVSYGLSPAWGSFSSRLGIHPGSEWVSPVARPARPSWDSPRRSARNSDSPWRPAWSTCSSVAIEPRLLTAPAVVETKSVGSRMRISHDLAVPILLGLLLAAGRSSLAQGQPPVPPDHARQMKEGLALF